MSSKSLTPFELIDQMCAIAERLESLSQEEVCKLGDAAGSLCRETARLVSRWEFEYCHAEYLKSQQTTKDIISNMMKPTGDDNAV